MAESSTKPYMIRAMHEWCTDNGYTPHLVVKVDQNTLVPRSHVQDGQITLNINTLATNRLNLGNEYIDFQARFNGKTEDIFVPVAAVTAIYARETGAGMAFEATESQAFSEQNQDVQSQQKVDKSPEKPTDPPPSRPKLSIVK
jgi:stringent starvation protein B